MTKIKLKEKTKRRKKCKKQKVAQEISKIILKGEKNV